MASSYSRAKGRSSTAHYVTFSKAFLVHENVRGLSGSACKMLLELGSQFRGYNNGDLQATFKILQHNGWNSKATIERALAELQQAGCIVKTRQGGRNRCSLFALSFLPINGDGKLDCPWHTAGKKYAAPNDWKRPRK